MTTESVDQIITRALTEIREKHGLAIEGVSVSWISQMSDPAVAITNVSVTGSTVQPRTEK